jgi:hypothetical protein
MESLSGRHRDDPRFARPLHRSLTSPIPQRLESRRRLHRGTTRCVGMADRLAEIRYEQVLPALPPGRVLFLSRPRDGGTTSCEDRQQSILLGRAGMLSGSGRSRSWTQGRPHRGTGVDIGKDEVDACVRTPDLNGGVIAARRLGRSIRSRRTWWRCPTGAPPGVSPRWRSRRPGRIWKSAWCVLEARWFELKVVNAPRQDRARTQDGCG